MNLIGFNAPSGAKLTPAQKCWGILKLVCMLLVLAGLVFAVLNIVGIYDKSLAETWTKFVNALSFGLYAKIADPVNDLFGKFNILWLPAVFYVVCAVIATFGQFFFGKLLKLDVQLPAEVAEKLQKKLQKYEYKHSKRVNNKQDRAANKELKKDYKQQYKENKN